LKALAVASSFDLSPLQIAVKKGQVGMIKSCLWALGTTAAQSTSQDQQGKTRNYGSAPPSARPEYRLIKTSDAF
jgi:hypothetical protein